MVILTNSPVSVFLRLSLVARSIASSVYIATYNHNTPKMTINF